MKFCHLRPPYVIFCIFCVFFQFALSAATFSLVHEDTSAGHFTIFSSAISTIITEQRLINTLYRFFVVTNAHNKIFQLIKEGRERLTGIYIHVTNLMRQWDPQAVLYRKNTSFYIVKISFYTVEIYHFVL